MQIKNRSGSYELKRRLNLQQKYKQAFVFQMDNNLPFETALLFKRKLLLSKKETPQDSSRPKIAQRWSTGAGLGPRSNFTHDSPCCGRRRSNSPDPETGGPNHDNRRRKLDLVK